MYSYYVCSISTATYLALYLISVPSSVHLFVYLYIPRFTSAFCRANSLCLFASLQFFQACLQRWCGIFFQNLSSCKILLTKKLHRYFFLFFSVFIAFFLCRIAHFFFVGGIFGILAGFLQRCGQYIVTHQTRTGKVSRGKKNLKKKFLGEERG